jgi:hypothetical protein
MDALVIDRMPTSKEVRMLNIPGLDGAISDCGGYVELAKRLNLPSKKPIKHYTENDISQLIIETTKTMNINRMPSRSEISKMPFGGSLHNAIVRSGGYEYWAKRMKLAIKESETKTGRMYEKIAHKYLEKLGYEVEQMSIKHPYDLLVNGAIKTDVKVGKAHTYSGSRWHTFGINKKKATCDLYIIYAIDESDQVEKTLIIPGFVITSTSLNIGANSVYDKYIDRWDYFAAYDGFYSQFKQG